MSTVNTEYFTENNKRLARLINDFGELLSREDFKAYQEVVLKLVCVDKVDVELSKQEQKEFLLKVYNTMIDKFKTIDFDKTN